MKKVVFLFLLSLVSLSAFASREKVYLSCSDCNFTEARSLAFAHGNATSGFQVGIDYVIFDSVNESINTFEYVRIFEPEFFTTFKTTILKATSSDDLSAFDFYLNLLDTARDEFLFSTPSGSQSVQLFELGQSRLGTPIVELPLTDFLNISRATITQSSIESFGEFRANLAVNQQAVEVQLRAQFLASASQSIRQGVRAAIREFLERAPITYTVEFANGDTVAFALINPFSSIAFEVLFDTAIDRDGNFLAPSSSGSDTNVGSFLNDDNTNGSSNMFGFNGPITVCTTALTGPTGDLIPQVVCFLVFV